MADQEVVDKTGEPFIARRAEFLDSAAIAQLVQKQAESVFGRVNIDNVIEKANFAITLAGKDDKVLAFAAFNDHPSVKDVKQSEWETWFHSITQCPLANPLNSLFLRLFVSEDTFSQDALNEILRTVFVAVPLLQYVFLIARSSITLGGTLETQFSPLPPIAESNEEGEPPPITVYVTHRHLQYPMLHIRPAVVEDNDDLLPVLQKASPDKLSETYGDYFIAELIESQDDAHQTVVAEVEGKGIGFISVTSEVDLSILWDCYHLEPYHGLRKPCDDDVILTPEQQQDQHRRQLEEQQKDKERNSIQSRQSSITSQSKIGSEPRTLSDTSGSSMSSQTSTKNEEDVRKPSSVVTSSTPVNEAATPTDSHVYETLYDFKGQSNVISVQLFCIDEQYESRSIDLLPAVFQKFPEHDLLIISQPQDILEFPLLQHFTRVPPRVNATISHDLYVLHKCSLLNSFIVRPVEDSDVEGVSGLVSSLQAEDSVNEDVKRYLAAGRDPISEGGAPLYVFVAECLDQIVGVVALRPVESLMYLRSHYNIEDYVYYSQHTPEEHMNIHHLLISPVFAPHLKHFMKESMRLSHSNNLYYPLANIGPVSRQPFSVTLALGEMVPIKPRRQIVYPEDLGINEPGKDVMRHLPMYTLYHTNRKLSLEPKIVINSRIVFIGASDVCLSALESLIFSPHLKFTNLTLVSPYGLSTQTHSMLPDSCCYPEDSLHGISIEAWVNIVSGALTAINRTEKNITVSMTNDLQECSLPYDYLVVTTGTQYSVETPKQGPVPDEGVYSMKGDPHDIVRMKRIQELIGSDGVVVVYGSHISSLTVIHCVHDMIGSDSINRIVWVQPNPTTALFPDPVQSTLDSVLDGIGVIRYPGCVLDRYVTNTDSDELTGIVCVRVVDEETKEVEEVEIECKAMICLEKTGVDERTFKAVNDACIVYDSRIVIDTDNCTNDKHILAAGSATKFSRYYRTEWSHMNFNSNEVGQKLAATILSRLDPTAAIPSSSQPSIQPSKKLLPDYTQPEVINACLPGGYYYMKVNKPNLLNSGESENGVELVTNTDNGYFRLWINEYERVQTITVFSSKPFKVSNYIRLYNVHEKLLNDLISRWNDKLITDLFLYLKEDWACAIFHDRFNDFLTEIQGLLEIPAEGEEKSMIEETQNIIEETGNISVEYNLKKFLKPSDMLQSSIQRRLQGYLHYNGYQLTMYAKPDMI